MATKTHPSIVGAIRGAKKYIGNIVVPLLVKHKGITIGRASSNTIVIKSPFVHKNHCRIYATETSEGVWMACVEDLSDGMTWLNGVRIGKNNHKALYTGCTLNIACDTITFYFIGIGQLQNKWTRIKSMEWADGKELVISNQVIGEGSQSEIYLVATTFPCRQQLVCRRTRQMKVFGTRQSHQIKKLQNEVDMLLKLRHPNIIRLLSYTINRDNTFSMIFPLVCGGTLENYTRKRPNRHPLHHIQIRFIMYQLFNATKYIHANGIIHKDLKPSNILVYKTRTTYPWVVITDFGLSINVSKEKKWSHSDGTRSYFAPEIALDDASSEPFDFKVDCWCLGLLLFELFTRMLPAEMYLPAPIGSSLDEMDTWYRQREWILHGKLDLQSHAVWSSVPPDAKSLLRHLLEKDPKKRYCTQQALASRFLKLDFTRHGLLEGYTRICTAYIQQMSCINAFSLPASLSSSKSVSSSSSSNSDTDSDSNNTYSYTRSYASSTSSTPSIRIGTAIPVPGNADKKAIFYNIINKITPPLHFENGEHMYPPLANSHQRP